MSATGDGCAGSSRAPGGVTTKRAPRPSSGSTSRTVPPCDSATARTIERPRPLEPAAVAARRGRSARRPLAQLGRDARAVVLDDQHDARRRARSTDRARSAVPGGRVADRVLHQVQRRGGAARRARRRRRRRAAPSTDELVVAGHRLELGGRLGDARRPRSTGSCGARAAGVGAREQQQVGDEAAHAARGAQRGGGGLALLAVELLLEQLEVGEHARQRRAQLVRGVGDELALARQRGLGLGARGVERVRACPRACARARRPRPRPSGWGTRSDGSRVRCDLRAASVSSAIGRIARRAVARPASSASAAPPSTPRAEEEPHARGGRRRRRTSGRAYWT